MDINRNNYEAFLLDLAEGKLNAEESRQLRDFLLLNPDCAEGTEREQYWFLEPGLVLYPGKERLKKEFPDQASELTESNFGLFSIARLEGDLTREQELDYTRVVEKDRDRYQEWVEWKQTKLIGETIVYEGKERLKKGRKPALRLIWASAVSAAAAVALIIILVRIIPGTPEPVMTASGLTEVPVVSQPESRVIPADAPVTLSIRKHQDPPELTGKDKEVEMVRERTDSTRRDIQEINEQTIEARPVKVAMMEDYPIHIAEEGIYDRISPLDLPPVSSQTGTRFSEKGLKRTYRDFIDEKDISLLTIANAGIDGINWLTGADLALNIARNGEGDVSGFQFRSNLLSVDAPVEKSE